MQMSVGMLSRGEQSSALIRKRTGGRLALLGAVLAGLAGCTQLPTKIEAPDESPLIAGSVSRRNYTPLEPAFTCVAKALRDRNARPVGIAVGDVKDYTGKYSQNEGNAITQGGALMVYSALGKLNGAVVLQERFDTRIAELELAYTDRRQLGDGRTHQVEQGKPPVPWVPYFGGTILQSDYYIVGGITEVNYNIASGGWEANIDNMGAKNRTYTMNIGVDLRIVDTRTLRVVKAVSLQKQIIGQEMGAGVYRFFGDRLLDINVGSKNQEPLQLGVRTTIEHGVLELVGSVTDMDTAPCVTKSFDKYRNDFRPADKAKAAASAASSPARAPAAGAAGAAEQEPTGEALPEGTQSGLQPQNAVGNQAQGGVGPAQVPFEFGASSLSASAMTAVERLAQDAAKGMTVSFKLLARDNETWPPAQRRELTNQRIKAITDALAARGVESARVGVAWVPSPTDTAITRDAAGFQLIATMVIGR